MARKSDLIRSIVGGGVIVANAPIAKRFGLYAAVLLHEIAYWCNRAEESGDGWAYRTQGELQEATTIASDAQLTARRKLVAAGVLIEQSRGLPKRLYFRIDWDALADALEDESVASEREPGHSEREPGHSEREPVHSIPLKKPVEKASRKSESRARGESEPSSPVVGVHLGDGTKRANAASKQREREKSLEAVFEALWEFWPNKEQRVEARRAFGKIHWDAALWEKVKSAAEAQCEAKGWLAMVGTDDERFVPTLARWLSGERWNDVVKAPAPARRSGGEMSYGEAIYGG